MISIGRPGDEDPLFAEPEYECEKCSDLLMQDTFQEWFCPTCVRAEAIEQAATLIAAAKERR